MNRMKGVKKKKNCAVVPTRAVGVVLRDPREIINLEGYMAHISLASQLCGSVVAQYTTNSRKPGQVGKSNEAVCLLRQKKHNH